MNKSYFDESYFRMPVDGSEILLCIRKISTYVNALAKEGFAIEQKWLSRPTKRQCTRKEISATKQKKQKCYPFPFCLRQGSYKREKRIKFVEATMKNTNQLIGCCGLDCKKCDARTATLTNDNTLREKTAALRRDTGRCDLPAVRPVHER